MKHKLEKEDLVTLIIDTLYNYEQFGELSIDIIDRLKDVEGSCGFE